MTAIECSPDYRAIMAKVMEISPHKFKPNALELAYEHLNHWCGDGSDVDAVERALEAQIA